MAGSNELATLLKIQDADTSIDQLNHLRSHLPAHKELAEVHKQAVSLRSQIQEVTQRRDDVAAQQVALEGEVSAIEERIEVLNKRLYGDMPVGPKDAEAMSREVKHLNERRLPLEDAQLEVMELLEPLESRLSGLEVDAELVADRERAIQGVIASEQAEINERLAEQQGIRAQLVGAVSGDLMTHYESVRKTHDGVGAAALIGASCGGCHLTLSAQELEHVRRAGPDELVHCEDCGRILVSLTT